MPFQIPEAIALDWNELKRHMKNNVTESYVRLRMNAILDEPVHQDLTATVLHLHELARMSQSLSLSLKVLLDEQEAQNV